MRLRQGYKPKGIKFRMQFHLLASQKSLLTTNDFMQDWITCYSHTFFRHTFTKSDVKQIRGCRSTPSPCSGFDCWSEGVKGQLISQLTGVSSGVAFCRRSRTPTKALSRKTIELWPPCWWCWPQTESTHVLIWVMERRSGPPLPIWKLHAEGATAGVYRLVSCSSNQTIKKWHK